MPMRNREGAAEARTRQVASSLDAALFSSAAAPAEMSLFAPLHYEPGYGYPLLVWLHGDGNDERQLIRVMPLISMRNYVAVAVRGLQVKSHDGSVVAWPDDIDSVIDAEHCVAHGIEYAMQKFHVAPDRVFLAGFGSGGTMALRMVFTHPERFAGVVSLGGPMPRSGAPLSNLARARRVPVMVATGRQSAEYCSADVCRDLRLLHTAGMSVTLREYPCGHELSPQMLSDIDRWIIEQITTAGQVAVS